MFDSTGGENIEKQKGTFWLFDKQFAWTFGLVTSFGFKANLLKKFNEITEEAGVVEEASEEDQTTTGSTTAEKQTTQKCDKWHCCHFYYKYCWLDTSVCVCVLSSHQLPISRLYLFFFLYKIISI